MPAEFDSDEDPAVVEQAWVAEILRRLAEIKSGKDVGKPGEQVFAELRARSGRDVEPRNGSRIFE